MGYGLLSSSVIWRVAIPCFGFCSISSDPALYCFGAVFLLRSDAREARGLGRRSVDLSRSGNRVSMPPQVCTCALAHVRKKFVFIHSDSRRSRAPCAASACQPSRVRMRSRAPQSRFTAGLFRFGLRTASDILVCDVVAWVVFLFHFLLRSPLMEGIHNTGSIMRRLCRHHL